MRTAAIAISRIARGTARRSRNGRRRDSQIPGGRAASAAEAETCCLSVRFDLGFLLAKRIPLQAARGADRQSHSVPTFSTGR